jgi:hypothetical protein
VTVGCTNGLLFSYSFILFDSENVSSSIMKALYSSSGDRYEK